MAFPIPRATVPGIVSIMKLSQESVDELTMVLTTTPSISDPDEMSKRIDSSLSSINLRELRSILDTLYRLYYVIEFSGVSLDRFLDDFIEGIRESSYSELNVQEIEISSLRTKIEKLLNIDKLKITLKATRLQSDGERLYCESKVLSDIRPVFGDDPSIAPIGAVITHTLKLGYHVGRDHKEFHVVLDSDDLEALKKVIDRACAKDKTLRALMEDVKLPNLGI